MKAVKVLLLISLSLLYSIILNATTILIQKPETVVRISPLIVEAVVKNIRFNPISNLSTGEAIITLSIVTRITGSSQDEIIIRRESVTPNLNFLETEWLPAYTIGERFIICLWPTKNGYSTMGLYNGKFQIEQGLIKGSKITKEEFISEIKEIRSNVQMNFPQDLPRQKSGEVKNKLYKLGKISKVTAAGSFLNGEFITWNFTWDTNYLPVTMHYNSANVPSEIGRAHV